MFLWLRWSRTPPVLVAGLVLAAVAGCGKSAGDQDQLVSVQGQVLLGENPLTTGVVIFHPDASRGNTSQHQPRGQIDAQGHYILRTGQNEGAAPGWYKVAIIASRPSTDAKNPYALPQSLIPKIYNDPEKSGLAREVEKNPAPGAYDLQIRQESP